MAESARIEKVMPDADRRRSPNLDAWLERQEFEAVPPARPTPSRPDLPVERSPSQRPAVLAHQDPELVVHRGGSQILCDEVLADPASARGVRRAGSAIDGWQLAVEPAAESEAVYDAEAVAGN